MLSSAKDMKTMPIEAIQFQSSAASEKFKAEILKQPNKKIQ